jgi:hypothetical protein
MRPRASAKRIGQLKPAAQLRDVRLIAALPLVVKAAVGSPAWDDG